MSSSQPLNPLVATDDLSRGQMVIVSARWVFVLTGLFLLLADHSASFWGLRFRIFILLLLAVFNFYLFVQALLRRPTLQIFIYAASLADLLVISFTALAQDGFNSRMYLFYFPALLAISVSFPSSMLLIFTACTIFVYGFIGLTTDWLPFNEIPTLLIRLIVMTAIAFCGNQFYRLEQQRRRPIQPTARNPIASPEPEPTSPLASTHRPVP